MAKKQHTEKLGENMGLQSDIGSSVLMHESLLDMPGGTPSLEFWEEAYHVDTAVLDMLANAPFSASGEVHHWRIPSPLS